ncbi:Lysine 2,3-aminomutase [Candidatus Syntrophocurvum alkaliphilum]|uniref:L-lysine 2,3-aminomutase n=1 Tax=Candidatus Syntrophocurvum alkaliphilum TaxID=2293317 RepID=A0A6I6DF63_9FIRM|nr:lysine 2,3-aminomutase [Candidatus Syntrophocurvum alkaliphilum]QGT99816.1 Lysine 2,3-aminomutase [Candidatus Syntrophocurvum alkaliphilum]
MRNYVATSLYKDVSKEDWNSWQWQLRNRITTIEDLEQIVNLTDEERQGIGKSLEFLRMAITPYYAMLMNPENPMCPIRKQSIPTVTEINSIDNDNDMDDPLFEDVDSPVPGITHRYPDRALLLVTDQCSMYCRHCTRRRMAGTTDKALPVEMLDQALRYLQETPSIRDVIISGGDSLLMSDANIEKILRKLRSIKHIEIIRIGTRTPVVLPFRITDELCSILKKYQPIYINTHFNHPDEITEESSIACDKLADAGFPLGNQTVLLRGINDCPYIIKELVHKLLKIRVRPYYLYQCDISSGLAHFRTSVAQGIEIIEFLRGHTSGLAVPTYVIDAPGGGGKIPVSPQYMISQSDHMVVLRNYEGMISSYPEPEERVVNHCNNCEECKKHYDDPKVGIERIMYEGKGRLIPEGNIRQMRRNRFKTY